MARFESLGVVAVALLAAFLVINFSDQAAVTTYVAPVATSSPSAPATTTPLAFPSLPTIAETATTSKHASTVAPKSVVITKPTAQTPLPVPIVSQSALDASAAALRAALVNIICLAPAGSAIHSTSASGVIIGPSGYIITNAHVAQYFLLADQGVSCTIRIGDPARASYLAKLVFIPEEWIRDNATVIVETSPSGTGERDFALLAITGSVTHAPLPSVFPAVPLAYTAAFAGMPVVVASYGAQFLEFTQIETALSPTVVFGSIQKIFTFNINTTDVLTVSGSVASQEGSSGGGIINGSGTLEGLITTSMVTGNTSTRTLSAITAAYIRREYAAETGSTLDILFATPPAEAVTAFAPQMSALEAILLPALAPH
ncbi:MAG: trypsin-like peptidase domain-containing protein [bacterium]|nr:trypsin-like peptidase domain-containing protein [bacterium]